MYTVRRACLGQVLDSLPLHLQPASAPRGVHRDLEPLGELSRDHARFLRRRANTPMICDKQQSETQCTEDLGIHFKLSNQMPSRSLRSRSKYCSSCRYRRTFAIPIVITSTVGGGPFNCSLRTCASSNHENQIKSIQLHVPVHASDSIPHDASTILARAEGLLKYPPQSYATTCAGPARTCLHSHLTASVPRVSASIHFPGIGFSSICVARVCECVDLNWLTMFELSP